jgi:hypothetical protein
MGPHATLSYIAELINVTTANGIVNLKPIGSDAGIVFLAFSVVIVTQDSSNVELLTITSTNHTPGVTTDLYANSSKFNFDDYGGSPHMVYFMQWVTGQDGPSNETWINYYSYCYGYSYAPSNNFSYEIAIYCTGNALYLTGIKAGVLLVNNVFDTAGTAVYSYYSQYGDHLNKFFIYNMGVPYADFGQPKNGGHCLIGMIKVNLYRNLTNPDPSSFEFTYYGN